MATLAEPVRKPTIHQTNCFIDGQWLPAQSGRTSRITAELKPGAGVVTTRGHVHWVATEYGAVNLHGRTLKERADKLKTGK